MCNGGEKVVSEPAEWAKVFMIFTSSSTSTMRRGMICVGEEGGLSHQQVGYSINNADINVRFAALHVELHCILLN